LKAKITPVAFQTYATAKSRRFRGWYQIFWINTFWAKKKILGNGKRRKNTTFNNN